MLGPDQGDQLGVRPAVAEGVQIDRGERFHGLVECFDGRSHTPNHIEHTF
jgi:hypothetical protein